MRRTRHLAMLVALAAVACASRGARVPFAGAPCGEDEALLLGACVAVETADAYCGAGARFVHGACAFRPCEPAHALDVTTGECTPMRSLRDIAAVDGAAIFTGEALECEDGKAPVVDAGHVACVLGDGVCPRGTKVVDAAGGCATVPPCGLGELYDERAALCVPVRIRGEDERPSVVDVGAWLRLAIGPDGGDGARAFCQPLALHAAEVGLKPGDPLDALVAVDVRIPDDDVRAAYATVDGISQQSGERLPDAARARLDASTRPLLAALRALGGDATSTAAVVHVRCAVRAGERPAPIHLEPPSR